MISRVSFSSQHISSVNSSPPYKVFRSSISGRQVQNTSTPKASGDCISLDKDKITPMVYMSDHTIQKKYFGLGMMSIERLHARSRVASDQRSPCKLASPKKTPFCERTARNLDFTMARLFPSREERCDTSSSYVLVSGSEEVLSECQTSCQQTMTSKEERKQ